MTSKAAWKDSHRIAEFVANVVSGVVVVGIIGAYVMRWLVHAVGEAPSVRALVTQRLNEAVTLVPSGWRPCWKDDDVTVAGAMLECIAGLVRHRYGVDDLTSPEMISRAIVVLAFTATTAFVITKYNAIGWYAWIQIVVLLQWCIALYQMVRIAISISGYVLVKAIKHGVQTLNRAYVHVFGIKRKHAEALRQLMKQAVTYREWAQMASYLDQLEDKEHWKTTISKAESELCDFAQLARTIQDLTEAIADKNVQAIQYNLTSLIMRNKHGLDAPDLHLTCNTGTKRIIDEYQQLLIRAIEFLAVTDDNAFPPQEKALFFYKLKHAYGNTALCLSGGGSIAMYHMGVIKALIGANMMPNVISGSSGGSITAALAACNTNRELLDKILVNDIAVRFIPDGIRWFPPLVQQLEHCIKTGFLVEHSDFERTTMHYYGEPFDALDKTMHYTFQDAFLKTGRHVCITVSASDVTGHKGPKKLLLNHINTPHVLLWSAVAVSCSLPGIMKGKKLMARDHEGNVVPYDATGKEWVDGSIQHDLPMETMASCFNVTNFIVSQVNPHVVPFMGDDVHQPTFRKSLFHTLESVVAADVRHRLKMLAFLGLFPKIYGHQFSSYFEQNFSGHVTLIPDFIFLEAIGIKAILNPTRDDMDRYLAGGQRAVWPKLAFIGHLCAIEKCLDKCLTGVTAKDQASSSSASSLLGSRVMRMNEPRPVTPATGTTYRRVTKAPATPNDPPFQLPPMPSDLSLRRPRRSMGVAMGATGQWKDGERLAQFGANVIGGVFVVVGMSSYVVTVVRNAAAVTPSMSDYFRTRAQEIGTHFRLNMTAPACAQRSNTLMALVWECLEEASDGGANHDGMYRSKLSIQLGVVFFVGFVLANYKRVAWFCWLQLGVIIQWIIAVYQMLRISLSMTAYFSVKILKYIAYSVRLVNVMVFGINTKHAALLRQLMKQAASYAEWRKMAEYLDELEGKENWKASLLPEDHEHCDFHQLHRTVDELEDAIEARNINALKFMLPSLVMRNKLGIDAADLHLQCSSGTKQVIDKYNALVIQALEIVLRALPDELEPDEKASLFHKLKQSFGSSALCLSGGGAIAMYHMGVIKALLEANLLPSVVSGSSGGSIAAAMLACKTNPELERDILVRDVSTRFLDGDIRWFPPLVQQLAHCIKTGFLVECSDFERTTMHYYGEPFDALDKTMHYTFQDAFLKTGRHVCITVSASDVTGHKGPKKLLLNHINTPHVLLWSAVAVSCSLPGIMKGKKLMARDHEGNVVPYDATGKEWVDGSIQHDLPMETMASCFNVTNFIVSQVNPHVVPFMGDDVHQPTFRKSLFHTLESVVAADVRHRLKMLAFLGLFPKIYGHQFSSYFEQNFSGHVTLIPDFIFLEAIGIKAILNPTRDDMDRYLAGGQRAVWPKLAFIGHLCAIEKCLDKCLSVVTVKESLLGSRAMRYENWLHRANSEDAVTR